MQELLLECIRVGVGYRALFLVNLAIPPRKIIGERFARGDFAVLPLATTKHANRRSTSLTWRPLGKHFPKVTRSKQTAPL